MMNHGRRVPVPPGSGGCPPNVREMEGYEPISSGLWHRPTGTARIVSIGAKVFTGGVSGFMFVFDGDFSDVAKLPAPLLPPSPIVAGGDPLVWASPTRWDKISQGITVGISTTDDVFTDAATAFGVFFHYLTGDA